MSHANCRQDIGALSLTLLILAAFGSVRCWIVTLIQITYSTATLPNHQLVLLICYFEGDCSANAGIRFPAFRMVKIPFPKTAPYVKINELSRFIQSKTDLILNPVSPPYISSLVFILTVPDSIILQQPGWMDFQLTFHGPFGDKEWTECQWVVPVSLFSLWVRSEYAI